MKESAIGIVLGQQPDTIILVKRRDVPIWVFPGGGVDPDETPEQAVVREVLEETGLKVKIRRKVGEYSPINRLTNLTHVYECTPVSGNMQLTEETRDVREFNVNELPKTFLIVHRDWLEDARQNLSVVIKKDITRVTYWELAKYFIRHPIQVIRSLFSRFGFPINTD